MQRRLGIKGGVLRGFRIDRFVVFRHFRNNWDGLRAKPICSFLPPSRYFGLENGHLSGHIPKIVFISSGRIFRVLRTVGISSKLNLRWERDSGWPKYGWSWRRNSVCSRKGNPFRGLGWRKRRRSSDLNCI
ncbi:hypothetical protein GUJ93_ZPchr0009g1061 [Zizania palustris]|uniref:Uncharacterized protein n=1 Tax=Zizania palustris TaxID=103762 RepID=A0A8J5V8N3_ZIZPA|nr:hypothetical protein GUJ93_ZPchr0009g1061 [Zizania palustris]